MKIFLIGFHTEMNIQIAKELKNKGMEILYWTGRHRFFEEVIKDKDGFPNTIFHNTFDMVRAIPAPGIDVAEFPPVDSEMATDFLQCESMCWMMLDRLEDREDLILRQLKHLYYDYLRYWNGVLKKFKPDAIIFGTDVPHTAFNHVIYYVAKAQGIKTLMYKRTKGISPERLLFFDDYQDYQGIRKAYTDLKNTEFSLSDLSEEMQAYYKKQSNPEQDSTPFYQTATYIKTRSRAANILPSFDAIVKNIKNFTLLHTTISYLKMFTNRKKLFGIGEKESLSVLALKIKQMALQKKIDNYRNRYITLMSEPDYNKKFIYVPLHYQPEASTMPLGGIFDDQILMIENLSYALPAGWEIYIKENTIQWKWPRSFLGRYYNYYDQLLKIKNVRLISPDISSFTLFDKCQAVATVTGTAAWEGLLRAKPALLFGYTWFMDCEGVFQTTSHHACQAALQKIAAGYEINKNNLIKFLGAVEKVSIKGYAHKRFAPGADISLEEDVKNITSKILQELNIN